jgi:hypothetical protein
VPERDRDLSVDRILKRVMQEDVDSAPAASCLDGETIAAWTEGALHGKEASAVEHHVASCSRCRALMAVFVETSPAPAAPESLWRRWRLGWLVPLATAATAAALWVAVPGTDPASLRADSQREVAARASSAPAATPAAPSESFAGQSAAPPAIPLRELSLQKKESEQRARDSGREVLQDAAAEAAIAQRIEVDRQERTLNAAPQGFSAAQRSVASLDIVAPGGSTRWRIIGGQRLERSTSAGAEWQPVTLPITGSIAAIAAPSPAVCWVVGSGGGVYLTTDGTAFSRLPFSESVDLTAVAATDDRTATVSARDGRSWRTADGGMTWTVVR